MSHIKKKIERDYLFGCIKYKGQFELYLMPLVYWILNNLKYDPDYNPKEWEFVFRGDVLNVTDDNVIDFIRAIAVDKVDLKNDLENIRSIPNVRELLHFFIDFDKKLFVSSFPDIETEGYLPDESWTGVYGDPVSYLPNNIKSIFSIGSVSN